MSGRTWEPGDVALLTDRAGKSEVGICSRAGRVQVDVDHQAHWRVAGGDVWSSVQRANPVAVIDPTDAKQVERLRQGVFQAFRADERAMGGYDDPRLSDLLQAGLWRLLVPKPKDPGGLGAVVESGGKVWVAFAAKTGRWWRGANGDNRRWADLNVSTPDQILSAGWVEDGAS